MNSFQGVLKTSLATLSAKSKNSGTTNSATIAIPVVLTKYVQEIDWKQLADLINKELYDKSDICEDINFAFKKLEQILNCNHIFKLLTELKDWNWTIEGVAKLLFMTIIRMGNEQ